MPPPRLAGKLVVAVDAVVALVLGLCACGRLGRGKLFGTEDTAAHNVADLRRRIEAVEKRFRGAPKLAAASVYVYEGGSGPYAYTNQGVNHTIIEALGMTDTFADNYKRFIEVNIEELIKRNPDVSGRRRIGPSGIRGSPRG